MITNPLPAIKPFHLARHLARFLSGYGTIALFIAMACTVALKPSSTMAQLNNGVAVKIAIPLDFRESLRQFVINIGKFARGGNPNFKIIAEDALGLVIKADPEDDTVFYPAKTFIVNIDGILQREISTLVSKKQVTEESIKLRDSALNIASVAGLKVMGLEFSRDIDEIKDSYAKDAERGIAPFVAESQNLSTIPPYPDPVFNTNSENIVALQDIQNFVYLENTQGFGSMREYINALRETDYDAIIINVYHGRNPLNADDIRLLKFKKTGGPRMVFATMDVSTAPSSVYFWQQGWKQGTPPYIDLSLRNDPDRYRTHFWDPRWQSIIYGDANSYVAGIVSLGFDGVVIRGLNGWRYYATGETEEEQDAVE